MEQLTLEMLIGMKPGIFAQGETVDSPEGCNMTGNGQRLRWVASRGDIHDWAIYVGREHQSYGEVKAIGDKVHDENNIKRLVPCTDEALKMYRK